ncbi:hypothetical protein [Kitasatospora aureofaciens]|uniref:hypothetical protein n=1 Tax=Kitasatospora aureofaciens TaxID=1894 RepID=UPI0037C6E40B
MRGRTPLLIHTADESAEWRDWVDRAVEAFGLTVATRLRGHGLTRSRSWHRPPAANWSLPQPDRDTLRADSDSTG